jgi:eukaryotic-like serine/threonine-protein kinase
MAAAPPGLATALQDRYRLDRELGQGGMATVYLAHDQKHERDVALKVLRPDLAALLGRERFLAEIHLTARLDHPHILTLIDSGESGGFLWYVVPYIRGESLRQKLAREKQLGVDEALAITGQVAGALEYAHQHGVIHRDLKPENILLHEGEAMLADFGIALAVKEAGGNRLTETGLSLGTPQYMSPEQATGDRQLDARSDVYSLGAVLYEMLAGEPPHTGATAQAVVAKLLTTDPIRIRTIRPALPATIEEVIHRALTKVREDRYSSAGAMLEALRRAQGGSEAASGGRPFAEKPPGASRAGVGFRRMGWLGLVAVLLVGGYLLSDRGRAGGSPAAGGPDARRIAVLYFDDRSPSRALGHIATGLTEALIHELSDVPTLQVISANGVAPFRTGVVRPDSIARELGVGTLVSGALDERGDSVRLTVTMIDPPSQREIGHATFQAPRAGILALQDTLAVSISEFLRLRLGKQVAQLAARAGTRNDAAWELVQQAEQASEDVRPLVAGGDTGAVSRQLARADSLLAAAERLDARWSEPIIRRGWLALSYRRITGFDKVKFAGWVTQGAAHAERALALDHTNSAALQLRGTARYFHWLLNLDSHPLTSDQLLAAAEQDLRAGTAADNPDRAADWGMLSHLLARTSRLAEAKLAAIHAYETDPYLTDASEILYRLYATSLDMEDAAETARWCREGFRRFPGDAWFTECRLLLHLFGTKPEDIPQAWQLLDQEVGLYPPAEREFRRRSGQLFVAMVIVRAGLPDSARRVAARARTDDPAIDPTRELVYVEVLFWNLLGDRKEALDRLALYLAANPQDRANVANDQSWWFRGLRDEPRFKDLVGSR